MGLDDVKKKYAEEEAEKNARRLSEKERNRKNIENKIELSMDNDLPKLKLLENDFWKYSYKFLEITKLRQGYTKRKSFLGIFHISSIEIGSIIEDYCPTLTFHFYGKKEQERGTITIQTKKGILHFKAQYGISYYSSYFASYDNEVYASHNSKFNLDSIEMNSVVSWLEEQFVVFVTRVKNVLHTA